MKIAIFAETDEIGHCALHMANSCEVSSNSL